MPAGFSSGGDGIRTVRRPIPTLGQQDDLATIERAKVVEVLRREAGNKTRAARALGIDRRKLYRLVEKYEIHSAELAGRIFSGEP